MALTDTSKELISFSANLCRASAGDADAAQHWWDFYGYCNRYLYQNASTEDFSNVLACHGAAGIPWLLEEYLFFLVLLWFLCYTFWKAFSLSYTLSLGTGNNKVRAAAFLTQKGN